MHRELAGLPGAGAGQALDQPGELAVGHGQQHQISLGHRLVGRHQRHAGQQPLGTPLGICADTGACHDLMSGAAERGTEHGSDPADANDGNPQPGCVTVLDHGIKPSRRLRRAGAL